MSLRAKRGNESPMTFFSFQDIVSCMTGILIMISLMLSMELIDRPEGKGKSDPAVDRLKEEIETARSWLEALKTQVRRNDDILKRWATGNVVTQAQLDALILIVKQLAEANRMTVDRMARVESEKAVIANQVILTDKDVKDLKDRVAILDKQIKDNEKKTRVTVLGGSPSGLSPLFVEVSADEVTVAQIPPSGFAEPVKRFTGAAAPMDFLAWSRSRRSDKEYFVLLVRPEGADKFALLAGGAIQNGFRVGWDVWSAERKLVRP